MYLFKKLSEQFNISKFEKYYILDNIIRKSINNDLKNIRYMNTIPYTAIDKILYKYNLKINNKKAITDNEGIIVLNLSYLDSNNIKINNAKLLIKYNKSYSNEFEIEIYIK